MNTVSGAAFEVDRLSVQNASFQARIRLSSMVDARPGIAINHCQNLLHTWHHRHVYTTDDETVWETAAGQADSPLRVLETKELGQRIQKTLDALPKEYRLLLLLVADQKLSYEEIGALTDQTSDAIRGKLHRARRAFAVIFEKSA